MSENGAREHDRPLAQAQDAALYAPNVREAVRLREQWNPAAK
jgi:hypothetical protein